MIVNFFTFLIIFDSFILKSTNSFYYLSIKMWWWSSWNFSTLNVSTLFLSVDEIASHCPISLIRKKWTKFVYCSHVKLIKCIINYIDERYYSKIDYLSSSSYHLLWWSLFFEVLSFLIEKSPWDMCFYCCGNEYLFYHSFYIDTFKIFSNSII